MATALRLRASRTKFSPGDPECKDPAPFLAIVLMILALFLMYVDYLSLEYDRGLWQVFGSISDS